MPARFSWRSACGVGILWETIGRRGVYSGRGRRVKRFLRIAAFALLTMLLPGLTGADGGRIVVRADPSRLSWELFRPVAAIPGSREDARIAAEMSFPQPLRIAVE